MLNMILIRFKEYKRSAMIIVVMTVMAIIFIYTFGVGFNQDFKPAIIIYDQDESYESEKLIEGLVTGGNYDITFEEYDKAVNLLENNNALAVIVIPKGYSEAIYNKEAIIEMIKVGEVMEHISLRLEIDSVVTRTAGNTAFIREVKPFFDANGININEEQMYQEIELAYRDEPMLINDITAYDSGATVFYDSLKQSFMGFIIFFSLFTMVFGIGGIVEDKESRVWHRQKVSPIGGLNILGSALIVGFIVGFGQIGIMILTGKYAFNIDLGGSLVALLLVVAFYVVAAMSLGLFISGLVKSEQQLSAFTPLIVVSTSMLGGCMWPLEMVSNKFIRALSLITPQRWAMEGFQKVIIYNGGIGDVLNQILYLVLLSIIFFGLALIPYNKTT